MVLPSMLAVLGFSGAKVNGIDGSINRFAQHDATPFNDCNRDAISLCKSCFRQGAEKVCRMGTSPDPCDPTGGYDCTEDPKKCWEIMQCPAPPPPPSPPVCTNCICYGRDAIYDEGCLKLDATSEECQEQVACVYGDPDKPSCFAQSNDDPGIEKACEKFEQNTTCAAQIGCVWRAPDAKTAWVGAIKSGITQLDATQPTLPGSFTLGTPSVSSANDHAEVSPDSLDATLSAWQQKYGLPDQAIKTLQDLKDATSINFQGQGIVVQNDKGDIDLVTAGGRNWGNVIQAAFVRAHITASVTADHDLAPSEIGDIVQQFQFWAQPKLVAEAQLLGNAIVGGTSKHAVAVRSFSKSNLTKTLQSVWDSASLQAETKQPTSSQLTNWAQVLFTDNKKQAETKPVTVPLSAFESLIETEILGKLDTSTKNVSTALANFRDTCAHDSATAIMVQSLSFSQGRVSINSAFAQCPEHARFSDPDVDVFIVGYGGTVTGCGECSFTVSRATYAIPPAPGIKLIAYGSSNSSNLPWTDQDINVALDNELLLVIAGTAHSNGVPISPIPQKVPSAWLRAPTVLQSGVGSWFNTLCSGITSFCDAFQSIANTFGSKSTTKEIHDDTCLGFTNFAANTSANSIKCIGDEHLEDFVDGYFGDLSWVFPNDPGKAKAELMAFKYAGGVNLTLDHLMFTTASTNYPQIKKILKNKDDANNCSNWFIMEYSGAFDFAPDSITWEKSSKSWFGFVTKTEDYTTQVPHKITPDDIQAVDLLMQIIMYREAAGDVGVQQPPWPELPNCP